MSLGGGGGGGGVRAIWLQNWVESTAKDALVVETLLRQELYTALVQTYMQGEARGDGGDHMCEQMCAGGWGIVKSVACMTNMTNVTGARCWGGDRIQKTE